MLSETNVDKSTSTEW